MNIIGNDIIRHIFDFILTQDFKEYRTICTNINNIITFIYFSNVNIDMNKIENKDEFIHFINKYTLYINIINLHNMHELTTFVESSNYSKMFKSIRFDENFDDDIITRFPQELQKLEFIYKFNKKIQKNILPEGLTALILSNTFNQEIKEGDLPTSLINLRFKVYFNKQIYSNVLPPSLKKLIFSSDFNQPLLPNILPHGLIHLEFGLLFNQEIEPDILPETLEYLSFYGSFNKDLNETNIPKGLKTLRLSKRYTGTFTLTRYTKIIHNEWHDTYQKIDTLTP
jgi:hypothetical protein